MLERSLRLVMINHQIVARGDGQGRVNFEIIQAALRAGYEIDVISSRCAEEIAQHPRARQHELQSSTIRRSYCAISFLRFNR